MPQQPKTAPETVREEAQKFRNSFGVRMLRKLTGSNARAEATPDEGDAYDPESGEPKRKRSMFRQDVNLASPQQQESERNAYLKRLGGLSAAAKKR